MLVVDMTDLPHAMLHSLVADHCSRFGSATLLKVLPPDDHNELGIAEIEMATPDEADNLARRYGDSRNDRRVVIVLVQKELTAASAISSADSMFTRPAQLAGE